MYRTINILSLKDSLPELLAPLKQSSKPGKWQDAHVRVAHLIHDSQIKDVQQKLADTIAKFETQNASELGLAASSQNLNLAQNLAQNQAASAAAAGSSLDQAILMQLQQQEAELKRVQNQELTRSQNAGTPNTKKRKTPVNISGGQSSSQITSSGQIASSSQIVANSQQVSNTKSIPSSGTASLRATPTSNVNPNNPIQTPSGGISNSSGIASGMQQLSHQQLNAQQQQAMLQASQALNFDNLDVGMTQALAAALQQQNNGNNSNTDVNVLQYLTAIDQMQAAGMNVPTAATQVATSSASTANFKTWFFIQHASIGRADRLKA